MNHNRIVVIPCKLDKEGKVVISDNLERPYGKHHVLGVYNDSGYWDLAHIDSSIDEDKLREIVKIIAGDKPVEFDPEFYNKVHANR